VRVNELQKPVRGMAVAKKNGLDAARDGKKLHECPYVAPAWRSAWIAAYERAMQLNLSFGVRQD